MIRTRFAPSPTGYLHIGGLRTCLYTFLLAKKLGGTFILRIEDTDQNRLVEGAVEALLDVLKRVGLEADEGPFLDENSENPVVDSKNFSHLKEKGNFGPYIQSQRTALYQKYAKELIEKGKAYYCFCTLEELDQMREEQTKMKLAPMYDRRCMKLTFEEVQIKLNSGKSPVVRQKIARDKKIEFIDLIRGKVSFMGSTIDDQVLLKSDQHPTYHLANVVDDHLMEITHVIRGEEWLTSTPKHLELYEALGWQPPQYAHLPLLLNADKTKLSKRQNDVSVESYLAQGYLKEALINFVALLGWHPGKGVEQEIFSLQELIEKFSLEQVNKGGPIFNREKLDWFNFHWQKKLHFEKLTLEAKKIDPEVKTIQKSETEFEYEFANFSKSETFFKVRAELLFELCKPHLKTEYLENNDKLLKALLVNEEKILKNPREINELVKYFFEPQPLDKNLMINPKMGIEKEEDAINFLKIALNSLQNFNKFDFMEEIKNLLLDSIKDNNLKNGQVLWPMRIALTHEQFSVGAFEAAWVLGKAETLKRLEEVLK